MHPCLVVRHAAAEATADSGRDEDRALTPDGAAAMKEIAIGLQGAIQPVDVVITSPLRRARQTAEIIGEVLPGVPPIVDEPALAGGAPADILSGLVAHCEGERGGIVLVGHEPDLGCFVSYALAATSRSFHSLRKGGACLLEFPALPRAGNATLEWALEPDHLMAVAAYRGARR